MKAEKIENYVYYIESLLIKLNSNQLLSLAEIEQVKWIKSQYSVQTENKGISLNNEKLNILIEKLYSNINKKSLMSVTYDYFPSKEGKSTSLHQHNIDEVKTNTNSQKTNELFSEFQELSKEKEIEHLSDNNKLLSLFSLCNYNILKNFFTEKEIDQIYNKKKEQKKEEMTDNKKNISEIITNEILNHQSIPKKPQNNLITNASTVTNNKEFEEELNNEIFSYTKNMKNYAKNFSTILIKDNQKLTKLEEKQTKEKNKTDIQNTKLKDFHYSISIGYCKLLGMIAIVLSTFLMALLIMRIFPKFQ